MQSRIHIRVLFDSINIFHYFIELPERKYGLYPISENSQFSYTVII